MNPSSFVFGPWSFITMLDHRLIYQTQARDYDRLVSREDYQGNILRALIEIRPELNNATNSLAVIEMGAGTGRLTRLLAARVRWILACDVSPHMLSRAAESLIAAGPDNWQVAVADNRALPVRNHHADLAIAGWSFGHTTSWQADRWREEIGRMVAEMRRVLRPGGTAVILETLGTGRETPRPPAEALAAYYAYLEQVEGFAARWIRTDYRFQSTREAETLIRFFFGGELADWVAREKLSVVPEYTGLWWNTI